MMMVKSGFWCRLDREQIRETPGANVPSIILLGHTPPTQLETPTSLFCGLRITLTMYAGWPSMMMGAEGIVDGALEAMVPGVTGFMRDTWKKGEGWQSCGRSSLYIRANVHGVQLLHPCMFLKFPVDSQA